MEFYDDEPLSSQYPDNVAEKFANAFSRRSAYDGPGYCTVTYSREFTDITCLSDLDFYKPIIAGFIVIFVCHILLSVIRSCCCARK